MPDAPAPVVVEFRDVGLRQRRGQRLWSWEATYPAFDIHAIERDARRRCGLLRSRLFAVYDTRKRRGQFFAGPHACGTFTVREEETTQ